MSAFSLWNKTFLWGLFLYGHKLGHKLSRIVSWALRESAQTSGYLMLNFLVLVIVVLNFKKQANTPQQKQTKKKQYWGQE